MIHFFFAPFYITTAHPAEWIRSRTFRIVEQRTHNKNDYGFKFSCDDDDDDDNDVVAVTNLPAKRIQFVDGFFFVCSVYVFSEFKMIIQSLFLRCSAPRRRCANNWMRRHATSPPTMSS